MTSIVFWVFEGFVIGIMYVLAREVGRIRSCERKMEWEWNNSHIYMVSLSVALKGKTLSEGQIRAEVLSYNDDLVNRWSNFERESGSRLKKKIRYGVKSMLVGALGIIVMIVQIVIMKNK